MMAAPLGDEASASGCFGKQRFTDPALARKVAHQSSQRKDAAISAYKCTVCNGWHVGGRTAHFPGAKKDRRK